MRGAFLHWLCLATIAGMGVLLTWKQPEKESGTLPETPQITDDILLEPPVKVTGRFLQAIREGDDKTADSLMTAMARQETAKMDLHVAPPGSQTARFTIGKQQVQGKQARVVTTWTDLDEEGVEQTDSITWLLKFDAEAWRISGMETELFPGEKPLVLDFEDPKGMIESQEKAEAELVRRQKQGK